MPVAGESDRIYRRLPRMRGGIAYSVFGVATFAYLCFLSFLASQRRQSGVLHDSLTASLIALLWASWLTVVIVGIRSSFLPPPRGLWGSARLASPHLLGWPCWSHSRDNGENPVEPRTVQPMLRGPKSRSSRKRLFTPGVGAGRVLRR